METLGRLKTIVASLENGLELGDVPETLQWCIEMIELQAEEINDLRERSEFIEGQRDEALAEVERLNGLRGIPPIRDKQGKL